MFILRKNGIIVTLTLKGSPNGMQWIGQRFNVERWRENKKQNKTPESKRYIEQGKQLKDKVKMKISDKTENTRLFR